MTLKSSILLIEDEENIRSFIATTLKNQGYKITTASTGREGLHLSASLCPDIILLDLGLPDLDGMDVIKQLRDWGSTPIIVISARSHEQEKAKALDLGADDYITKPFNAKILITRCNNLIRNRLLMQSRFAKDQISEVNLLAANPIDKSFLDRVIKVVDKYVDNEDFDIGILCQELGMGRTLLHTKFKAA